MNGKQIDVAALRACLDNEFDQAAHPLGRNGWKLDAAGGLAERAAEALLAGPARHRAPDRPATRERVS